MKTATLRITLKHCMKIATMSEKFESKMGWRTAGIEK